MNKMWGIYRFRTQEPPKSEKKLTENFDVTMSQCHKCCLFQSFEFFCSMWKHVCKLDVLIWEENCEQNKNQR